MAISKNKSTANFDKLLDDPDIQNEVQEAIQIHGKQCKLTKTQIPTEIKLVHEDWTPDSGLVTAALKLRRKKIYDYYKNEIDHLFNRDKQSSNNNNCTKLPMPT